MLDRMPSHSPPFRSLLRSDPPQIRREDVPKFNAIAKARPEGTLTLAGKTLRYAWCSRAPLAPSETVEVWAYLDEVRLGARIERGLVEALFLEEIDFNQIDQRLYALVVEHLLTDWISQLETKHEAQADVTVNFSPTVGDLSAYSFNLFFEDDDEPFFVTIHGNTELLHPFLSKTTDQAPTDGFTTIPLRATIESASLTLSQSDLDRVSKGDLLFLERKLDSDGIFKFKVAGADFGLIRIDGSKCIFTEWVSDSAMDDKRRSSRMVKDNSAKKSSSLNVDISIEVGHRNMKVAEIDALIPGTVIEMEELSTDDVRLRTNGEVFAHAKIIEVGEGMGLWITKVL